MKVDLHMHCYRSRDSLMPISRMVESIVKRGIDCVAITDHNTIDAYEELKAAAPFMVICGEEINTTDGEVIGIFLHEAIPAGMSARDTVRAIHSQGGLVIVPHPFDRLRNKHIREDALIDIAGDIDLIEVLNARVTFPADNAKSLAFANERGIIHCASTDSHTPGELGRAYTEIASGWTTPQEFREAMRAGAISGKLANPFVHTFTALAKLRKRGLNRQLAHMRHDAEL